MQAQNHPQACASKRDFLGSKPEFHMQCCQWVVINFSLFEGCGMDPPCVLRGIVHVQGFTRNIRSRTANHVVLLLAHSCLLVVVVSGSSSAFQIDGLL